ncbi:flagellar basal body rod protein FlgB [Nitrosomonas sp.]|uniref:flagellar basal body rod protein FlgB n=1 Tax=Nitrosomonas sp. TaxID=42353 RepID=UPI001D74865A|nr:flagellar basal body rod protein FlgB [Nitrosomonas sp.]MCB1947549.1 flagellar basal body rod protein FlgB [Nitrosomonas sp.]MCP5244206.1 flagellar basal body rod protein FlgB [Burkholderiales bacterium]MDR4515258.1 flagellar basal body rod protein FlgB [Nitrosomonas sp.]
MISKLDKTVNFHQQALSLRAARHELLASNVANADTPNFKAKDIDFSSVLKEKLATTTSATTLSTTSPMHIGGNKGNGISSNALYRVPLQPSADGNTVDMDSERTRFADNSVKYDASLTFISGQFRNLLSAIQER